MSMKMMKPVERRAGYIHTKINKTPVNKDSIEAITPETDKKVTGTFINIECPGQPGKVCGKYYPGMQYFEKTFLDGEKATIPLSVARWINERCYYEKHTHITDPEGNPIKDPRPVFRYKFNIENYAA